MTEDQSHHTRRECPNCTELRGNFSDSLERYDQEIEQLRKERDEAVRRMNAKPEHLAHSAAIKEAGELRAKVAKLRGALEKISEGWCLESNGEDIGRCEQESPMDLCEVCRDVVIARAALRECEVKDA